MGRIGACSGRAIDSGGGVCVVSWAVSAIAACPWRGGSSGVFRDNTGEHDFLYYES